MFSFLDLSLSLLNKSFSDFGFFSSFLFDVIKSDTDNGSLHSNLSSFSFLDKFISFDLLVHSSPSTSPVNNLSTNLKSWEYFFSVESGVFLRKEQIGSSIFGNEFLASSGVDTIFAKGTALSLDHHLFKDLLNKKSYIHILWIQIYWYWYNNPNI